MTESATKTPPEVQKQLAKEDKGKLTASGTSATETPPTKITELPSVQQLQKQVEQGSVPDSPAALDTLAPSSFVEPLGDQRELNDMTLDVAVEPQDSSDILQAGNQKTSAKAITFHVGAVTDKAGKDAARSAATLSAHGRRTPMQENEGSGREKGVWNAVTHTAKEVGRSVAEMAKHPLKTSEKVYSETIVKGAVAAQQERFAMEIAAVSGVDMMPKELQNSIQEVAKQHVRESHEGQSRLERAGARTKEFLKIASAERRQLGDAELSVTENLRRAVMTAPEARSPELQAFVEKNTQLIEQYGEVVSGRFAAKEAMVKQLAESGDLADQTSGGVLLSGKAKEVFSETVAPVIEKVILSGGKLDIGDRLALEGVLLDTVRSMGENDVSRQLRAVLSHATDVGVGIEALAQQIEEAGVHINGATAIAEYTKNNIDLSVRAGEVVDESVEHVKSQRSKVTERAIKRALESRTAEEALNSLQDIDSAAARAELFQTTKWEAVGAVAGALGGYAIMRGASTGARAIGAWVGGTAVIAAIQGRRAGREANLDVALARTGEARGENLGQKQIKEVILPMADIDTTRAGLQDSINELRTAGVNPQDVLERAFASLAHYDARTKAGDAAGHTLWRSEGTYQQDKARLEDTREVLATEVAIASLTSSSELEAIAKKIGVSVEKGANPEAYVDAIRGALSDALQDNIAKGVGLGEEMGALLSGYDVDRSIADVKKSEVWMKTKRVATAAATATAGSAAVAGLFVGGGRFLGAAAEKIAEWRQGGRGSQTVELGNIQKVSSEKSLDPDPKPGNEANGSIITEPSANKKELLTHTTKVYNINWYDNNTPRSEGSESGLDVRKSDGKVSITVEDKGDSRLAGHKSIDISEAQKDKKAYYAFEVGEPKDKKLLVVQQGEGKNGKLELNPKDTDPTHVVHFADGSTMQLGKFSEAVLDKNGNTGTVLAGTVTEKGEKITFNSVAAERGLGKPFENVHVEVKEPQVEPKVSEAVPAGEVKVLGKDGFWEKHSTKIDHAKFYNGPSEQNLHTLLYKDKSGEPIVRIEQRGDTKVDHFALQIHDEKGNPKTILVKAEGKDGKKFLDLNTKATDQVTLVNGDTMDRSVLSQMVIDEKAVDKVVKDLPKGASESLKDGKKVDFATETHKGGRDAFSVRTISAVDVTKDKGETTVKYVSSIHGDEKMPKTIDSTGESSITVVPGEKEIIINGQKFELSQDLLDKNIAIVPDAVSQGVDIVSSEGQTIADNVKVADGKVTYTSLYGAVSLNADNTLSFDANTTLQGSSVSVSADAIDKSGVAVKTGSTEFISDSGIRFDFAGAKLGSGAEGLVDTANRTLYESTKFNTDLAVLSHMKFADTKDVSLRFDATAQGWDVVNKEGTTIIDNLKVDGDTVSYERASGAMEVKNNELTFTFDSSLQQTGEIILPKVAEPAEPKVSEPVPTGEVNVLGKDGIWKENSTKIDHAKFYNGPSEQGLHTLVQEGKDGETIVRLEQRGEIKTDHFAFQIHDKKGNPQTILVEATKGKNGSRYLELNPKAPLTDTVKLENGEMPRSVLSQMVLDQEKMDKVIKDLPKGATESLKDGKRVDIATEAHRGGRDAFNVRTISAVAVTDNKGELTVNYVSSIHGDEKMPKTIMVAPESSIAIEPAAKEIIVNGQKIGLSATLAGQDARFVPDGKGFDLVNNEGETLADTITITDNKVAATSLYGEFAFNEQNKTIEFTETTQKPDDVVYTAQQEAFVKDKLTIKGYTTDNNRFFDFSGTMWDESVGLSDKQKVMISDNVQVQRDIHALKTMVFMDATSKSIPSNELQFIFDTDSKKWDVVRTTDGVNTTIVDNFTSVDDTKVGVDRAAGTITANTAHDGLTFTEDTTNIVTSEIDLSPIIETPIVPSSIELTTTNGQTVTISGVAIVNGKLVDATNNTPISIGGREVPETDFNAIKAELAKDITLPQDVKVDVMYDTNTKNWKVVTAKGSYPVVVSDNGIIIGTQTGTLAIDSDGTVKFSPEVVAVPSSTPTASANPSVTGTPTPSPTSSATPTPIVTLTPTPEETAFSTPTPGEGESIPSASATPTPGEEGEILPTGAPSIPDEELTAPTTDLPPIRTSDGKDITVVGVKVQGENLVDEKGEYAFFSGEDNSLTKYNTIASKIGEDITVADKLEEDIKVGIKYDSASGDWFIFTSENDQELHRFGVDFNEKGIRNEDLQNGKVTINAKGEISFTRDATIGENPEEGGYPPIPQESPTPLITPTPTPQPSGTPKTESMWDKLSAEERVFLGGISGVGVLGATVYLANRVRQRRNAERAVQTLVNEGITVERSGDAVHIMNGIKNGLYEIVGVPLDSLHRDIARQRVDLRGKLPPFYPQQAVYNLWGSLYEDLNDGLTSTASGEDKKVVLSSQSEAVLLDLVGKAVADDPKIDMKEQSIVTELKSALRSRGALSGNFIFRTLIPYLNKNLPKDTAENAPILTPSSVQSKFIPPHKNPGESDEDHQLRINNIATSFITRNYDIPVKDEAQDRAPAIAAYLSEGVIVKDEEVKAIIEPTIRTQLAEILEKNNWGSSDETLAAYTTLQTHILENLNNIRDEEPFGPYIITPSEESILSIIGGLSSDAQDKEILHLKTAAQQVLSGSQQERDEAIETVILPYIQKHLKSTVSSGIPVWPPQP